MANATQNEPYNNFNTADETVAANRELVIKERTARRHTHYAAFQFTHFITQPSNARKDRKNRR